MRMWSFTITRRGPQHHKQDSLKESIILNNWKKNYVFPIFPLLHKKLLINSQAVLKETADNQGICQCHLLCAG